MYEIIVIAIFIWLMAKVIGLAFKLTWGITKVLVCILMVISAPLLVVLMLFAGGIMLLIPLALIGIAFAIVKACD